LIWQQFTEASIFMWITLLIAQAAWAASLEKSRAWLESRKNSGLTNALKIKHLRALWVL
jgi:hypothetical protein